MSIRGKMSSFLGSLAGALVSVCGKSTAKPGVEDLKRAEFRTSTQRLGVRFGEKIRDVFRLRWIKRV